MKSRRTGIWIAAGSVSMTLSLSGCYATSALSITDHRALAPIGEITWNPRALHYSDATFGGIHLSYERYKADETNSLNAGTYIQFDQPSVAGGQDVKVSMTAEIARLAYRQRIKIRRHVELDAMLGAGYSSVTFDALGLTTHQYVALEERHIGLSGSFTARAVNLFTHYGAEAKFSVDTSMPSVGWQAALLARPNTTMTYKLGAFARQFEVGREPEFSSTPFDPTIPPPPTRLSRGSTWATGIFGSIGVDF